MKNLIYIFSLVAFITISCDEEKFLTEEPKDELYADNLYESYQGFRIGVNALLDFVRETRSDRVQSAELSGMWKIGVDNGMAGSSLSWLRGIHYYNEEFNPEMQYINGDASGQLHQSGVFLMMYQAINSANLIINRAMEEDVNWEGNSEDEIIRNKNEILGHAHLIRAWAYKHLAYTFGDVPLSTEEVDGATLKNDWERTPLAVIQQFIIDDLLLAEEYLATGNPDKVLTLSPAVAQTYLAEMYLWTDQPDLAETKAQEVVNNPNFALITERYGVATDQPGVPFMDQFLPGNILTPENTEALWILPNNELIDYIGQRGNSMRRSWVSPYYNEGVPITPENGGRGIGRMVISPWGFSIYEEEDDRFSEFAIRKNYKDEAGNIIFETEMSEAEWEFNNPRWASTRKWDWDRPVGLQDNFSFANQTYLRLAEVYLLYAEALYLNGNASEAAKWINKVRTRSNATPIDPEDVTLDFILDERSRELITEEHRRQTLIRTGRFVERVRTYNFEAAPNVNEDHILFPIPQRVIDANTISMDQNPCCN